MTPSDHRALEARTLGERIFAASLGASELFSMYLGLELGLYETLAQQGPTTYQQLAAGAAIAPRYAREWLEQQAAAAVVEVDDPTAEPEDRLYTLPAGYSEVLTQEDSPFYMASLVLIPAGVARTLPLLADWYRNGSGAPYGAFGDEFRRGQSGLNRNIFRYHLGHWIQRALPDLEGRLKVPGAALADIGCGAGWSSIALARAYPECRVYAFDTDEGNAAQAMANADAAGVADRVVVCSSDAAAAGLDGRCPLVAIFDALHDMPRPVETLAACRAMLAPGGAVLLMEPKAAEHFTAPASETERFLYAVSLLHCLPVGMAQQPSAATGTVMRPATLRAYAQSAGFRKIQIAPVDHRFFRLYCLRS